jgi:hypothetical protein
MRRLPLALALLALGPGAARAAQVAVVPLEASGVPGPAAEAATAELAAELEAVDNVEVLDLERVGRRLGVDVLRRARSCERDLFCLVEVGEVLRADRVVFGRLGRGRGASEVSLDLTMIDVAAASEARRLAWRVPDLFEGALSDALRAAARRLVASPDARLLLDLSPPDARVEVYGEALARPPGATQIPFHAGNYYVRVSAPGYRAMDLRLVVPRGPDPVPLYATLAPSSPAAPLAPALTGGASPPPVPRAPAFRRPLAWVGVGLGVAAAVAGGAGMGAAQAGYDELSAQVRYTPGVTLPASVAARERDDLAGRHELGAVGLGAGVALAVGALGWMVVEAALDGGAAR